MPNTTGYSFGDVVLVPFPFTDQSTSKKRPAVVISSDAYHQRRRDIVVMAITSQIAAAVEASDEVVLDNWHEAGGREKHVVLTGIPSLPARAWSAAATAYGRNGRRD